MTRDVVPAKFAALASNPFETLQAVYDAMGEYERDSQKRVLDDNALNLDAAAMAEWRRDHSGFKDEIRRFACGIAALRGDERLLRAFQAAICEDDGGSCAGCAHFGDRDRSFRDRDRGVRDRDRGGPLGWVARLAV